VETDFLRPGFAIVTDDFRRFVGRISVGAALFWDSGWARWDERGGCVEFTRFSAARAASTLAYSSKAPSGSSRADPGWVTPVEVVETGVG
jgi:hypothetical protein